jgi:subtilisin family serine protease
VKKTLSLLLCVSLTSCGGCAVNPGPGDPTPPPGGGYDCAARPQLRGEVKVAEAIAGRYIVRYRTKPAAAQLLQAQDVGVTEVKPLSQGFAAKLAAQAVQRLLADPNVEYVQQDGTKRVTPRAGAAASVPWGLDRIDQRDWLLDGAYSPFGDGAGVNLAIIDTGVTSHPDFAGRLAAESFTAHPGGSGDGHGHGTHVAGTTAGTRFGVAKAATLYAVRVLDASGSGSDSDVIRGIEWVTGSRHASRRTLRSSGSRT